MGNRINIAMKTGTGERDHVWIYSHWGGSGMLASVQSALDSKPARGRWNDSQYLPRILFDRILPDHESETGFGLSTSIGDNDGYPIIEVDCNTQEVRIRPFDRSAWDADWDAKPIKVWSFEDFCKDRLPDLASF